MSVIAGVAPPVQSVFADQAVQLLNFEQKLDINLLDSVVECFFGTVGPEVSFFNWFCMQITMLLNDLVTVLSILASRSR